MIIKKVKIKNIKKYVEVEYDFTKGIQLILGPNGSGKSTIIECIGWVVFNHLDTKLSNWVRWGEKLGSARVTLKSNDVEYEIYRDTDGTYNIIKGKDIIASGVQDVQMQIKKFFHIDDDASKVFRDIIGVSQELMSSQFSLAPSFKKKLFDPLLGIEKFSRVWNQLKSIEVIFKNQIDEINVEKAKVEGWISSGKNILTDYDNKQVTIDVIEKELLSMKNNFKDVDDEFNSLLPIKSKYERMKTIENEIDIIKGRIDEVKEREITINKMKIELDNIEEDAKKQERIRDRLKEMRNVEKELRECEEEHKNLSEQYETLRDSIEYVEQQYKDNFERIKSECEDFEKIELEFKEMEEQRIKLESEMEEIEKQILMAKEGKCPITGGICPVNVYGDVIKKKEKAIDFMERVFYPDYVNMKTKVGQSKNAKINLEKLIKMKEDADKDMDKVADIVNLINKVVDDIDRYNTILSNKGTLINLDQSLGNSLERYHELKAVLKNTDIDFDKLKDTLHKLEDDFGTLEIQTRGFTIKDFDNVKEKHSELKVMIREKEREKAEKMRELKVLEDKVKLLSDKEDEVNRIEERLDVLSRRYELVRATREKLREIPPEIAKNLLVAINNTANRYHNEIVGACTLEIDENYEVLLSDHKGTRVFKNLSGGEKMTTSVAIRLAFLNEITNIKFLALDEPTASVDDVRKQLLSDTIAKVRGVDQLFIISHDDVFMSQSDNIIEVKP